MIVDDAGEIEWVRAASPDSEVFDFRVQRYKGMPVLTWWEGITNLGVGAGEGIVLDQRYRELLGVKAGNGYMADLHEMLITPRNTALLIAYPYVHADLRRANGPKEGMVIDGVVQEVDLETGHVLFEWHSLDHIGLDESHWPLPKEPTKEAWDYVHLNSVDIDTDGDLLVNSRHTWAAYKIDRRTGTVRWRLAGKKSDFELAEDAQFAYQHDVRRRSDGAITLFDNAASQSPQPEGLARARAGARRGCRHRAGAAVLRAPGQAALGDAGATWRRSRMATSSSAGARLPRSRSLRPTAASCWTAGSPRATTTTGPTARAGRGVPRRNRRSWSTVGKRS